MTPEPADIIRAALLDAEGWERMLNARDALTELERRLAHAEVDREILRAAIELDAAERAYKAELGASEWESFVTPTLWKALEDTALRAEPAKEEA